MSPAQRIDCFGGINMDIRGYQNEQHKVLILNTQGAFPSLEETALFLTRSITLLGDRYLMGPVGAGPLQGFISLGKDGFPVKAAASESEAFWAFLRDIDQIPQFITDGESIFPPPKDTRWQRFSLPETETLLAL